MSSPPDSVGLVSGLDSNDLLQDLMRWSGGVQSGQYRGPHIHHAVTPAVKIQDQTLDSLRTALSQPNGWLQFYEEENSRRRTRQRSCKLGLSNWLEGT